MSIFRIVKYGDSILRAKCAPVEIGDEKAVQLLDDMLNIMYDSNGVGLAAPQIGVLKRLVVIDLHREPKKVYKLINPKIVWKSEEIAEFQEGCLSIPGLCAKLKRPASVSVEYFNESFEPCFIEKATDLLSSCLQHEIDHLDGKLYIDHLSRIKRSYLIKKFQKMQREEEEELRTENEELEEKFEREK